MKILLIHNDYGGYSGEEFIFDQVHAILQERGHAVASYRRKSSEVRAMRLGRTRAFFTGIHNPRACREVQKIIKSFQPDVAHLQNVFPLISPSVLKTCRSEGVPVVMNVQNFRLECPSGLFFSHGEICLRCKNGNEHWCLLKNCEQNLLKSAGYALRSAISRSTGAFLRHVNVFTVPTDFHKQWLATLGIDDRRLRVVPNMIDSPPDFTAPTQGDYVGFVGRISPEKGVEVLLEAASKLPAIRFRIAGNYDRQPSLPPTASSNVEFTGPLRGSELQRFYDEMRFLVVPSVWYEGLPTVIPQAMLRSKAVVASRLGGLPHAVTEGVTGMLFRAGDSSDLATCIKSLWEKAPLRLAMGMAAREEALARYSRDAYYQLLNEALKIAIDQSC